MKASARSCSDLSVPQRNRLNIVSHGMGTSRRQVQPWSQSGFISSHFKHFELHPCAIEAIFGLLTAPIAKLLREEELDAHFLVQLILSIVICGSSSPAISCRPDSLNSSQADHLMESRSLCAIFFHSFLWRMSCSRKWPHCSWHQAPRRVVQPCCSKPSKTCWFSDGGQVWWVHRSYTQEVSRAWSKVLGQLPNVHRLLICAEKVERKRCYRKLSKSLCYIPCK